MEALRISSIPQLACVPYKVLAELDFVRYEEHDPAENARLLRERKVDVALIPASDFVLDGGYLSLEFGMGSRDRTDSMLLYANDPVQHLDRIYLYECSRSSLALLKLLLQEKWRSTPEFVRLRTFDLDIPLGDNEGMLSLHELPGRIRHEFPVAFDIGSLWYRHTDLPFVFLIWAARPGVLNRRQIQQLHKKMYFASRASHELAVHYAADYCTSPELAREFVADNRRFYLDSYMLGGLNEFLLRSRRHSLSSNFSYRAAGVRLPIGSHEQERSERN